MRQGKKVSLRKPRSGDAAKFYKWHMDDEVAHWAVEPPEERKSSFEEYTEGFLRTIVHQIPDGELFEKCGFKKTRTEQDGPYRLARMELYLTVGIVKFKMLKW